MTQTIDPSKYYYVRDSKPRCVDGLYYEISADPHSDQFHPTQILSTILMYGMKPYNSAGVADLITYLETGVRSTHMTGNGAMLGFHFNVARLIPMYQDQLSDDFSELKAYFDQNYGVTKLNQFTTQQWLDMIQDIEKQFGESMTIRRDRYLESESSD